MSFLRGRRRWHIVSSVAIVAVAVALIGSVAAEARGTTGARPAKILGAKSSAKPTVVLVHGAFADNGGWAGDITMLRKLKYPVIAVSPQMNGLLSDAAYVNSVLKSIPGPVILVGHSYGGAVITNAAVGAANVKALVYVGAFVPAQGESLATILPPNKYPGSLLGPATTTVRPFPNAEAPGGTDGDIYIKAKDFRKVFAGDESSQTAAVMAATQQPLSVTADTQPSGPPAWKTIPSWDLITLHDHAIPPAGQKFMAHRAHAHIRTVPSAHDVMVSHPGAVVSIIQAAARATQ
jgi:pimeloyl-ACP methyl ester carboxylesterase